MKQIFFTLLLGSLSLSAFADPLPVGAPAPALTAVDQDGKPFDLGAQLSKGTTLVYFYPKAGTPGCTSQACSLRDSFTAIRDKGITVIGVSHDKPESQKNFQSENKLPFTLIADPDRKVAEAFGVPAMIFGLDKRQSFLVRDGKIVWENLKVSPATHTAEVLSAFDALPKS